MSVTPANPEPDRTFIGKVRAAMHHLGWLMPVTDEQLEAAEQRLDSDSIDCLPDLQDPYELFGTAEAVAPKAKRRSLLTKAFHEEAGTLRFAARKGQSIPDDIRAKMRKDRKEADNHAQTNSSAKKG